MGYWALVYSSTDSNCLDYDLLCASVFHKNILWNLYLIRDLLIKARSPLHSLDVIKEKV